jgi:hypothetical protein
MAHFLANPLSWHFLCYLRLKSIACRLKNKTVEIMYGQGPML